MNVIIITGATGGIGSATAALFRREGWEVVGTSRRAECEWALDVTSQESVDRLVDTVARRFCRVDALFNNAGFAQIGGFEEFDMKAHLEAFDTNVFGAMRLSKAVLPLMRRGGRGTIVNMGSVVSHLPAPFMGSYAASKHALEGFSTSLDHELRGSGLRSVLIRSGFMSSNIAANTVFAPEADETLSAGRIAVHRNVDAALKDADDPCVVAEAVHRACRTDAAPAVVDVGKEATALARLSRFLPLSVFERGFRRRFGLP